MYEYVQTATGWVLCWGGATLYRQPAVIVSIQDDPRARREDSTADEPLTAMAG
jgi:hypothetical protein